MKYVKMSFSFLLLFGFTTSYAQLSRTEHTGQNSSTKSQADNKIRPEEYALMWKAGTNNPAKIDGSTQVDPKLDPAEMPTEEDYGPSNARPLQEIDIKLQEVQDDNPAPSPSDVPEMSAPRPVQPEGDRSGNNTDYRNMPAGTDDQPQGSGQGCIQNYREMNGSNQQPAGKTPSK